jgi:hypothetical protein
LLASEARTSALLYAFSKLAHGLRRNATAFAACQGSCGLIDGGKDLPAGALALLLGIAIGGCQADLRPEALGTQCSHATDSSAGSNNSGCKISAKI